MPNGEAHDPVRCSEDRLRTHATLRAGDSLSVHVGEVEGGPPGPGLLPRGGPSSLWGVLRRYFGVQEIGDFFQADGFGCLQQDDVAACEQTVQERQQCVEVVGGLDAQR